MPCGKLAVQVAQVHLDLGLILDNPAAIEAMRQFVAQIVGEPLANVSAHGSTAYDWAAGYSYYCAGQPAPAHPIPAGQDYVDFVSVPCAVRVYRGGQVELRDGWQLGHPFTYDAAAQVRTQEQAAAAAQSIAWLLTQQQLITTLTSAGAQVINDQITAAGRLVQFQIGG